MKLPGRPFARTAVRIAWRDLKSSPGQWSFTVITIAISFACLSGIRGAAVTIVDAVSRGSRDWLASDVIVNLDGAPSANQLKLLDRLQTNGIASTLVTSAMSTAASENSPDFGFIIVKAVDPASYPFYGTVALDTRQSLRDSLAPDTTVVSEEVLSRLAVRTGDNIRIGAGSYRIAGVIVSEPDRFVGIPGAGMRCVLSREGYARSGIARGGSSEFHRFLLRLPSGVLSGQRGREAGKLFPWRRDRRLPGCQPADRVGDRNCALASKPPGLYGACRRSLRHRDCHSRSRRNSVWRWPPH